MTDKQKELSNLTGKLLDSARKRYGLEAVVSENEASMSVAIAIIKDYQSARDVEIPELTQVVDILEQNILDVQKIRAANKDPKPE